MRAAIVSLYGYFNYGNRLQSYAAQQVLKKLGVDSDVIYVESTKSTLKRTAKCLFYSTPTWYIRQTPYNRKLSFMREKSFERFTLDNIKTKRFSSVNRITGYDYYVLGSDQVWNPKLGEKHTFLEGSVKVKKKSSLLVSL